MKMITFLLLALPLSGLAQTDGPPRCEAARQCEVMWNKAQQAVGMLSNMRIRLSTDTRIETFAPVKYSTVGAVVTKSPVGDAGYEFRIQIECYRSTPCGDIQRDATRLFREHVTSP